MTSPNLLDTPTAKAFRTKAPLALALKLKLAVLAVLTLGICGGSLSPYGTGQELLNDQALLPLPHHLAVKAFIAPSAITQPSVLGESTTTFTLSQADATQLAGLDVSVIAQVVKDQLNQYLAAGEFKGSKGDKGDSGTTTVTIASS